MARTGRPKLPPLIVKCKGCGVDFVDERRRHTRHFCSSECKSKSDRTGQMRDCKECGQSFYVPRHKTDGTKGQFCSNACRISTWNRDSLAAQKPGSYKVNGWKVYERKCVDCGYDEHPEIILLHHIDGDRKNGKISNLAPLCQNCHCLRHLAMGGNGKQVSSRRHHFRS